MYLINTDILINKYNNMLNRAKINSLLNEWFIDNPNKPISKEIAKEIIQLEKTSSN